LPPGGGLLSVAGVTNRYWPLFDLRLASPDLVLRPVTEDDLGQLADLLPADVEQDPQAGTFAIEDQPVRRGMVLHQGYWKAFGSWRPDAWRLSFLVSAAGQVIGVQELEGSDFPVLRTVDTSSFLVHSARGRGYGQQMRRAVLALAFGPLQAQAAITSAWHDNHASLGVSRALGYQPNGESLHAHPGRVDTLLHLRLKRADWLAGQVGAGIEVSGFEPCRPLFGLPAGR
jgi:RimJ/RimL family protein N-acetyltransferase